MLKRTKNISQNVLPQAPMSVVNELIQLAPPETSSKTHVEATLDILQQKQDRWFAEQSRRLKKAEKRITLCAFLHVLESPFDPFKNGRHYSWCPADAWFSNKELTTENL